MALDMAKMRAKADALQNKYKDSLLERGKEILDSNREEYKSIEDLESLEKTQITPKNQAHPIASSNINGEITADQSKALL